MFARIVSMLFSFSCSMLELVQMKYMTLMVGEGRNNFILEFNENREEDPVFDTKTLGKELRPPTIAPIGGLFGNGPVTDALLMNPPLTKRLPMSQARLTKLA